jgi:hypothetical protein
MRWRLSDLFILWRKNCKKKSSEIYIIFRKFKKAKIILHPPYLPTSTTSTSTSTSTSIPIQAMISLTSIDSKKFKQQLNELLSVSSNLSMSYSSKAHAETLKRNNQESLLLFCLILILHRPPIEISFQKHKTMI